VPSTCDGKARRATVARILRCLGQAGAAVLLPVQNSRQTEDQNKPTSFMRYFHRRTSWVCQAADRPIVLADMSRSVRLTGDCNGENSGRVSESRPKLLTTCYRTAIEVLTGGTISWTEKKVLEYMPINAGCCARQFSGEPRSGVYVGTAKKASNIRV